MNGHFAILEQAGSRELLAAWAILLAAVLLILFWYLARKVESRSAAWVLGGMILLVSAGQFAAFLLFYVPTVASRMEQLGETITLVELDNRKERDVALAFQRENATLNQTVRNLRARVRDLEEGVPSGALAGSAASSEGPPAAAQKPAGTAVQGALPGRGAVEGAGETPVAAVPERPAEAMTQEQKWMQPRASNARYHVTILTPESNTPLARNLEETLKHLRFQTEEPVFADVDRKRVVYYSETDYRRAAYLVWLLQYKFKIELPMELSPDERNQGRLQIHLTP